MQAARVLGTVTSTVKHQAFRGLKLLVVQPFFGGRPQGRSFLAVDFAQAGVGDTVLVVREGSSTRQLLGRELAPVHAAVVGIVDGIFPPEEES
ncbi:MAG: EutN/CcmL family microcompartment protein [Pseudomonadota bacterium]